ncbi:HD domain-containing protein [Aureitalea marina]|uniref:Phosphohydrolase n=1 Tax=Aureitalea marina TaxID=930804 RepID=A0A2S7KSF1_9FLAO|nr:HD domain-containing protein [Aureitalea marina]PQB05554.1 phosphohydrolase [Aureitalea marina]
MSPKEKKLVSQTGDFVKKVLENAEGGHDWYHTQRVYWMACYLAQKTGADLLTVSLGALLHDIADSKFHGGDETIGPKMAANWLTDFELDSAVVQSVIEIVKEISFKGGHHDRPNRSLEFQVVQDADRLDALGAIGIARTFNYGGFKNRAIYDPNIPPKPGQSREEYKNSQAPTINHFYEKLLLLKDRMNTDTARKIANKRHKFMAEFLDEFYAEWNFGSPN